MIDITKYRKWKDALDINNNRLDEVVREGKKINTSYQKYLQENPYKAKRKELIGRKEKLISRLLELTRQGYEKYDNK